jgi:hypothetical protein
VIPLLFFTSNSRHVQPQKVLDTLAQRLRYVKYEARTNARGSIRNLTNRRRKEYELDTFALAGGGDWPIMQESKLWYHGLEFA